jgi:hypothetical protein
MKTKEQMQTGQMKEEEDYRLMILQMLFKLIEKKKLIRKQ